eukprot:TRINITY_DN83548_c0_g1_i1.p1 TRINITY_DN83548_c0_g1~~TRINITY_DN83548_c0_g1_i1.p1  ORF type:complete len:560 (+),score=84.14 TRINITY_DN83548_c0_g1_i1:69-1748(+)
MAPPPLSSRGFSSNAVTPQQDLVGKAEVVAKAYRKEELEAVVPPRIEQLLNLIQTYIFTRRIRVKDNFLDFDPLRSGRCTSQQFIRVLNNLVPGICLTGSDMKAVADHFSEERDAMKQKAVCYNKFIRAVDSVFSVSELEKKPTMKVPRPGSMLNVVGFHPKPCSDEADLQRVLHRLALLMKTRGVIFKNGFQDAERSNDASMLCPRYGGKVTEAQFLQHFPFLSEISDYELSLILQRYTTDSGDVNYQAMDNDLNEIPLEPESPRSKSMHLSMRSSMMGPAALCSNGTRRHLPGSLRKRSSMDQDSQDLELLARLKAEVHSRRLRVHGCFQEMDRLRRGCCTFGQARTVFTILRIDLEAKELESLSRMFGVDGMFSYLEFCNVVNEVPLSARSRHTTPSPAFQMSQQLSARGTESSRARHHKLLAPAEDLLAETESFVAKKILQRTIHAKATFQDYDKTCSGKVTRSQFYRVMDNLQLALSPDQLDVMLEAYSDHSGQEMNYLEMLNSVQRRAAQDFGTEALCSWNKKTPEPSKYFTRRGQIVPLSGAPPLSARPYTR